MLDVAFLDLSQVNALRMEHHNDRVFLSNMRVDLEEEGWVCKRLYIDMFGHMHTLWVKLHKNNTETLTFIHQMDLPLRVINSLHKANIRTITDLSSQYEHEVRGVRGVGKLGFRLLQEEMNKLDLHFKAYVD